MIEPLQRWRARLGWPPRRRLPALPSRQRDSPEPSTAGPHPGRLSALLLAERERWVLWLPVGLAAGIAGYFAWPSEPPSWLGAALAIGFASVGIGALIRGAPRLAAAVLALALIAGGFATAQWRTARIAAPVLDRKVGPSIVEGRVLAVAPLSAGWRLWLAPRRIGRLPPDRLPATVRIKMHGTIALAAGDVARLRATLLPPPSPSAPGAFDFARRAYFQQLGAVGFAFGRPERLPDAVPRGWPDEVRAGVERLRSLVGGALRERLPSPRGDLAAALVVGHRGGVPETVIVAMRDSGLAHLLAISGLHIGLASGIAYFSLRGLLALVPWLALRAPIRAWAAVGACAVAVSYLLLAGAPVPTQRAVVMTGLVFFAIILGRRAISMRLLAVAALTILAFWPEALIGASFQLSFAAVMALIATYEIAGARFGAWRREGGRGRTIAVYLAGVVLTTIVAGLATGPFAAFHFQRVALYGVAANLVAVPLMAFWIMPAAMLALVLMPLGLGAGPLLLLDAGLAGLIATAETVAGWPGAVEIVAARDIAMLLLAGFGLCWLCLWRHWWRALGVLPLAAALFWPPVPAPDVFVNDDASLVAVRDPDAGLVLSNPRRDGFAAALWHRRLGLAMPERLPRLACDGIGCIARREGVAIAHVSDPRALAEDCRWADVLIAAVPAPWSCRGPATVIDRFDVWREGAMAIWLPPGAGRPARITTVADDVGARPWSLHHRREAARAAQRFSRRQSAAPDVSPAPPARVDPAQ